MDQLRNTNLKSGTQTAAYTIARLERDLFLALVCVFAKYFFDVFFVREALSEDFEDSEQQLDNCIHRMRLPKVND
jgi:hypothetical protein